jgi:hypothetical protein
VSSVRRRARLWAAFRCEEPVVVLESDDWGLRRRPCRDEVAAWGTPSDWADEHEETPADVERLAEVLDRHGAVLTANLVAANPDHEAIAADDFATYHDRPIDQTLAPEVLAGLRDGPFSLQLHGRAHVDVDRWLADLRDDEPGARALFAAGADGGLALVKEHGWRYHSEQVSWSSGAHRSTEELVTWLRPAVETVGRVAGTPPRAAVAPHYVLSDEGEAAWAELGIKFVQAAERRLRPGDERSSYLGQRGPGGLVHLTRNVRFDPRPSRSHDASAQLRRCVAVGLPAVVDTHRINYTGPWATDALRELDALLDEADALGARYLSTPALGDAVRGDGSLTPRHGLARTVARSVAGPVLGRA